ncbi:SRPBCC family protein [Streptomyces sp. P6-2-1]|uniref:SRPBCC family protein n=1 Tax=unclassified Streptomyces TaxID=2593676 RepID=UPI003D35ED01
MALRQQLIARSPAEVWRVLADARRLGPCLTGRAADPAAGGVWPEPGAVLSYGARRGRRREPLRATVRHAQEPRTLDLEISGSRLGRFRVTLDLRPWGPDTLLVLAANPLDEARAPGRDAALATVLRLRHRAVLARLARAAEEPGQAGSAQAAPAVSPRDFVPTRPY